MTSKRAAVVTAVTLVPLAVFGGVGFAKGSPSASEYQYGPSGHQYGKVAVCHKTGSRKHPWHRVDVSMNAWNHGHSHHGDFQIDSSHPCPPATASTNTSPTNHGDNGNGGHGNNGHHGKP